MAYSARASGSIKGLQSRINGAGATARAAALDELHSLLERKGGNSTLPISNDRERHDTFDAIFNCALIEKSACLGGNKKASADRLTKCARTLRSLVEHEATRLRRKTALALADHLTQILSGLDEGLAQPLVINYIKALLALLSRPANVEQLAKQSAEGWISCVKFCVDIIVSFVASVDEDASLLVRASPAPGTPQPLSSTRSSTRSSGRSNPSAGQRPRGYISQSTLLDLLECLHHLVLAPHSPLQTVAARISRPIVRILQIKQFNLSRIQQFAFSTLGTILGRIAIDDLAQAGTLARDLVPLISHWWQAQKIAKDELSKSVRDEMLRAMFSMSLHLEHLTVIAHDGRLRTEIEDLLDVLWSEYARRDGPDQLCIDDLNFSSSLVPDDYLRTDVFSLHPHNREGERKWAVLQSIALLEDVLFKACKAAESLPAGTDEQPRKRRRTAREPNRLRQKLKLSDPGTQLTALQLVPFLAQSTMLSDDDAWDLLADLATLVTSKQTVLASWAMLAAASCAMRNGASHEDLSPTWRQLWQVVVRNISLPGVARAACVLLHTLVEDDLVSYHGISNDINDIVTTADVNGPAILTDSTLLLMLHLLKLRNLKLPNASRTTCLHIIRWVFLKWNPEELAFASVHGPHVSPPALINLLRAACGASLRPPLHPQLVSGGPISQAWKSHYELESTTRYLLLLEDPRPIPHLSVSRSHSLLSGGITQSSDPSSFFTSKKLVLELLHPKLEELQVLCDSWNKRSADGFQQISTERLQSLFTTCICASMLLPQLTDLNTRQSRDIEPALFKLVDDALSAVRDASESHLLLEALLRTVRPVIPQISTAALSQLATEYPPLLSLLSRLASALQEQATRQSSGSNADFMDIDDEFDSQVSKASSHSRAAEVPRHNTSLSLDLGAFHLDTTMRLYMLQIISQDIGQVGLVQEALIDHLLTLSDEDFMLVQGVILELLRSDAIASPESAFKIIEKIGGIVGKIPDYDCCEVALCSALDIIEALLPVWINTEHELADMVGDLYHYFVKNCLPDNQLSPNVQKSLVRLLLSIMKIDTQYASNMGLPSCRSTLLFLVKQGTMPVRFFLGTHISDMFGLYVLKVHDDIFVDVLSSLPSHNDDMEGIAYRLFVLAELACRWPTLLRRCIYHIFETPGNIPSSVSYATRCLCKVATALQLKSPTELFRLFAPQLLYTWLLSNNIDEIPFTIFGFSSLQELIQSSQSEASALMIMRGPGDSLDRLAAQLGKSPIDVVSENFSKVMAYSIAHGIARSKSKSAQNSYDSGGRDSGRTDVEDRGEAWVRKLLGTQPFIEAVYANFADMAAHFMDLFDQEGPIEQYFVGPLSYAADILAEMKQLSHSAVGLPPNQQPVFKGRHLVRQLNHLCNLAPKYDFTAMWTPALVVFVARKLINTIHPALGSLHACSVLRKIRILISLAGPVALSSYPLEMLLHSVRSFIVDPECADDAMGVSQYLITKGAPHLEQAPSFLAGYALSTLASLRVFLESSQSSTTQESQFKATMSKATQFHASLTKYLAAYASPIFKDDPKREAVFRSITHSAAHIRSSGNADRGTHESNLLLEILQDEGREDQLLNDSSRDLALGLLCGDFRVPDSSHDDMVETDSEAIERAPVVWRSCMTQTLSDHYLAWAGRVAGRSFAASGSIPEELLQESQLAAYLRIAPGVNGSQRGLIYLLQGLTTHKEPSTAGLAESALRSIVTETKASEDDVLTVACQETLTEALFLTSDWGEYYPPSSECPSPEIPTEDRLFMREQIESADWLQRLCSYLARSASDRVVVLAVLPPVLKEVKGFAERAFPYILHLALLAQNDQQPVIKRRVSDTFKEWLAVQSVVAKDNQKLAVNAILYLRTQQYPNESSVAERTRWLDIDPWVTASAASRCGMHKTALLFLETGSAETGRSSRRSSAVREQDSGDLLLAIFENIDDPDAYYGLPQTSSLASVLARLEYEKDGAKSLAFRGAQYDSHIRRRDAGAEQDGRSLVQALGTLGLAGLSNSLLQMQQSLDGAPASLESTFETARRLEQWNLPVPEATSNFAVTVYKTYQTIHQANNMSMIRKTIHDGFGETMRSLSTNGYNAVSLRQHLGSLAVLSELYDVLDATSFPELEKVLQKFDTRTRWMRSGRYDDVGYMLSCRNTTLSVFSQHGMLRAKAGLSPADAKQVEIRSMLMASDIYRFHKATQECLNLSTALTDMIQPSEGLGLVVDAAIKMEAANSLWDHGEMTSSIGLLQSIDQDSSLKKQTVAVSRSDLLSKIGYQVSVARLEKPQTIQKKYLEPALKELKGKSDGKEAGHVFHQFAMFCDEQLQNPDGLEDLARLQNLRQGKCDEVMQLKDLVAGTRETQLKNRYTSHLAKARQWLELDEQELRRVEQTRNEFVRLSLENYLLSLIASDAHNNDALRFTALWLERSDDEGTNEAVKRHFGKVPTRKFATLMNQLTSRLQDQSTLFQRLLLGMVLSICIDHPYHGMYHIWAGMNSRLNKRDEVAVSRHKATEKVARQLATTREVASKWLAIDKTSKYYHALAADRNPDKYKTGARLRLKDCPAAHNLLSCLVRYPIPPPTMQMELAMDKDYSGVPLITSLESTVSIASGVSAPKIITAIGSDGAKYRQLVKGGNDDLRQDAIMEQVFSAVSSLLKLHRATQQRNLDVRTYKVLPLTASSGLIEFVPNTIPLHEFLIPAHERYHPKDLRGSQCRREITNVQGKSVDVRVATYRKVTERFQPVMRYFFMEYFVDPDEWFAKRVAYTRTTAAISMLGHVLGLGDRHGHNILLDTKTGEVVHIDLGVAFEMGRVLPVPELVPFRLTRDIVDGMGVTKTEGVFRRCCEFTLDALREDTYSIMTILDVLRYDPLYSWSISPVRLAKLQDARRDVEDKDEIDEQEAEKSRRKGASSRVNEPSEADRALEVVRKKLSKTLSVTATVNDLINQGTDERNLAVLYAGWAAYA